MYNIIFMHNLYNLLKFSSVQERANTICPLHEPTEKLQSYREEDSLVHINCETPSYVGSAWAKKIDD